MSATFVEGVDYAWVNEDRGGLWRHIPFADDYVRRAELLQDYRFTWRQNPLYIRRGYRWNGTSAGMPCREDDPRVMRATLVHDWCYDRRRRPAGMTRKEADRLFFEILEEDGAPRWFVRGARVFAVAGPFAWAWANGVS